MRLMSTSISTTGKLRLSMFFWYCILLKGKSWHVNHAIHYSVSFCPFHQSHTMILISALEKIKSFFFQMERLNNSVQHRSVFRPPDIVSHTIVSSGL